MNIRISFPIDTDMCVVVSIDALQNMIEKADARRNVDLTSRLSCVVKDVIQDMEKYYPDGTVVTNDNDKAYKYILMDDAETRIRQRFDKSVISVRDFVEWCWTNNAGHWPDGTPITDD